MTEQFSKKNEGWSGRFNEPVSELVQRYTGSVFFDQRLARFDIQGSLAHAEMLAHVGLISSKDFADIQSGLGQIQTEIDAGKFNWTLALEDVHLNIEKRLTDLIGDVQASGCIRQEAATIRSPPISGFGHGLRLMRFNADLLH
ncbi:MAG: argininosuccinate lyase [Pseudomonadota bacterium]